MEKKDVISIEREVRGNREGDISNAIDVYKKEEGGEDRTLGNPRGSGPNNRQPTNLSVVHIFVPPDCSQRLRFAFRLCFR